MTGESFPVEKTCEPVKLQDKPKNDSISELTNIVFMGSSVVNGTALGVVIRTGLATQFGEISRKVASMPIESSFDKGIRKFTWLMIRFMILLVIAIFVINAFPKGKRK